MRAALRDLVSIVVLAGCSGRSTVAPPPLSGNPQSTGGIPVLPGDGDRAYVADTTGLVEVAPTGMHQVIASPPVRWCTADAKSRVVWFTTDTGLAAFDLDDRKLYPVILDSLDDLDVTIELGTQQLAQHDDVDVDVKLVLAVADSPTLRAEIGCDGDGYFRCYDEGHKLNQRMVELLARAKQVRIEDPTYVTSLAGRGAAGSLWSPPMPAVAPTSPVVDPKNCTVLASCGQLTAIPGSGLWLVDTANSQGDYFHRTRELWDPATSEFVTIDGGTLARSTTQPNREGGFDTDYAGLRSSPSGLTFKGVVFSPSRVIYAPQTGDENPSPVSCGWASGGWRVP